jgi:hypothetical protein
LDNIQKERYKLSVNQDFRDCPAFLFYHSNIRYLNHQYMNSDNLYKQQLYSLFRNDNNMDSDGLTTEKLFNININIDNNFIHIIKNNDRICKFENCENNNKQINNTIHTNDYFILQLYDNVSNIDISFQTQFDGPVRYLIQNNAPIDYNNYCLECNITNLHNYENIINYPTILHITVEIN